MAASVKVVPELLQFDKKLVSQLGQVALSSVRYDSNIPRDLAERLEQTANIANCAFPVRNSGH
jgi:hypothetical protein